MSEQESFIQGILKKVLSVSHISKKQEEQIKNKVLLLADREINLLVIGGTGVGKSSTINALFKIDHIDGLTQEKAKVGTGPNPETEKLTRYQLSKNLIVWDSPGLGESIVADVIHTRAINQKLLETTKNGEFLIDLILVVLDGGSRDYKCTLQLLKRILPNIKDRNRILIGINRIDLIALGYGWNYNKNEPTPKIKDLIDQKIGSVKNRIYNECHLTIDPVVFCAGRSDDGWGSSSPYQITELFCQIVLSIPDEKRIAVIDRVKPEVIKQSTPEQKKIMVNKTSDSVGKFFPRVITSLLVSTLTGGLISGCFITSAVCNHLGKADNCHMLYTFRQYRDKWLLKQKGGLDLIREYYTIAPGIVDWIDSCSNSAEIYTYIHNKYLKKCYHLIKHKQYRQCKYWYIKMVMELEQQKISKPM